MWLIKNCNTQKFNLGLKNTAEIIKSDLVPWKVPPASWKVTNQNNPFYQKTPKPLISLTTPPYFYLRSLIRFFRVLLKHLKPPYQIIYDQDYYLRSHISVFVLLITHTPSLQSPRKVLNRVKEVANGLILPYINFLVPG